MAAWWKVEATLSRVDLIGTIRASSEIEEAVWFDPGQPHHLELAPLTRETVLPLATRSHRLLWKLIS
jgi:hypothetical protein